MDYIIPDIHISKEKMIFAADFDGCLCDSVYPDAGEPNKPLIELLKALRESGHIVILWTCRSGEALQTAVDIIDLNPEQWQTMFSRFCNEDRE